MRVGCHWLCSGIVVYAMVIGRLPFSSPFKDEYHRQRMLRHIQKGLAPFHDREMAFLPSGTLSGVARIWCAGCGTKLHERIGRA